MLVEFFWYLDYFLRIIHYQLVKVNLLIKFPLIDLKLEIRNILRFFNLFAKYIKVTRSHKKIFAEFFSNNYNL